MAANFSRLLVCNALMCNLHTPRWHRTALAALLAGSAAIVQAQSLATLTEQAQGYDAAWHSARAQFEATLSQSEQTKAGLLPQIGLQAGSQYSETWVRGNFPTSRMDTRQDSASLQAQQPLYHPANYATYQQGQRSITAAQAQLDAARQDLLVRTATAYFDLLTAQESLRLVQAQKVAVQEQLTFAQRNFEVGTATITDSREAQARFDLVRAQEIATNNDVRVRQTALQQLVGTGQQASTLQPWPVASAAAVPSLVPDDLSQWLQLAQDNHPLLRQAQVALEVAALETEKAQAGHKPTVNLQASFGTQRNPDGTSALPYRNNVTAGTVGVMVNVPLFAGFAVKNRVRETLSLQEKAQADLDDAQRKVAQAVRTAYFGVESAAGQVQALEAAVASSQSALDANRLGYEVGVRINMDVLNAQSQLYESQRDLAQARHAWLLGHLQLRQAAGVLAMQDVHAINDLLTPPHCPCSISTLLEGLR